MQPEGDEPIPTAHVEHDISTTQASMGKDLGADRGQELQRAP